MKHRKLRIAWSVVWGIAAVLLVALWVRSYWWSYQISGAATDTAFRFHNRVVEHWTVFSYSIWIVGVCIATIATAPWIYMRFSLRTLLIATTLVAVGLGLIVWAEK